MPSMPLRSVPGYRPRHAFDRDPTPEYPAVRVYPAIPWRRPPSPAVWVRDDGQDTMDQNVIAEFTVRVRHFCPDMSHNQRCDVCKQRFSFRYDDFFGYVCTMCEITHPLRYKARGVNPWGGRL